MLHISHLTCRIGGRLLLDDASASINTGQRVGLVGRNGSGKSTLFRLITGEAQAESGRIDLHGRARVGHLAQEPPPPGRSLIDTVLAADTERTALLEEAETATDPERIAHVHERLAAIEAHSAPARAASILDGLGFDAATQKRDVGEFSGGWRMRVALASVLFARPDLLLLDEPSNHLDLESALWLEDYLARWPGTMIVISHDRTLLNKVVHRILHLEGRKLHTYNGGFDTFERTRREQRALQEKQRQEQEKERQRIQWFIDKFRAKAGRASQAQSRIKMLERMEPVEPVVDEGSVRFHFPEPRELPPPLLTAEGASVGYEPGRPILRHLNFRIDPDERVALLGANGNGKSTLARLVAGRLDAQDGRVTRAADLTVGYFAQDQMEELDQATTPFQHMQKVLPDHTPPNVRARLGAFGFAQERAEVPVSDLSGGERARLLFALISRHTPNLLLLDEPTNHLDIDAREALVEALNTWPGAVVLVSHDYHLLEMVADRLWLVEKGGVREFDGDLAAYRHYLLEEGRRARREAAADRETGEGSANRKQDRKAAADKRARLKPLRDRVKKAERAMEKATADKEKLEAELADPALYDGPADRVTDLQKRLGEAQNALAEAEEEWLAAQEALEEAEQADAG